MVGTDAAGNILIAENLGSSGDFTQTIYKYDPTRTAILSVETSHTIVLTDGAQQTLGYVVSYGFNDGTSITSRLTPESYVASTVEVTADKTISTYAGVRIETTTIGQKTAYITGIDNGLAVNADGTVTVPTSSGNVVVHFAADPLNGGVLYSANGKTTTFGGGDTLEASTGGIVIKSIPHGGVLNDRLFNGGGTGLQFNYTPGIMDGWFFQGTTPINEDTSIPLDNSSLDLTNAITPTGTPLSDYLHGYADGSNNLVYVDDFLSATFTGASVDGAHNLAGSIVTDGWMPGAEQLSSIDFTSALLNPASVFYSGGAWYSGSNTTFDLGASVLDSNALFAFDYLAIDPLVLDLNGDGVQLTSFGSAPVLFDIDHDAGATLEQTGWVSAQDGIVVDDLNGNGKIDGINETLSEYFNGTIGTGGSGGSKPYANGFAALKSLDSNNDNQFTSADTAWTNIKIWVDANHDGKTDAGELKTLASLGITSISLTSTAQSGLVNGGNEVLATGSFVQSSVSKTAQAVNLLANPSGHTFTASGSGTLVTTEGGTSPNLSSYVAHSSTGETIDVSAKGVSNAYGASGNDILSGNAGANWLAGGMGSDTFNAGAGDDVLLIDASDQQASIHEHVIFTMNLGNAQRRTIHDV